MVKGGQVITGTFTANTDTAETDWIDVTWAKEVEMYWVVTYANQSGATIDGALLGWLPDNELGAANYRTLMSFAQLSIAGSELVSYGLKIDQTTGLGEPLGGRVKISLAAGGAFGSSPDEVITYTVYVWRKNYQGK